jgi:hypothetical protein
MYLKPSMEPTYNHIFKPLPWASDRNRVNFVHRVNVQQETMAKNDTVTEIGKPMQVTRENGVNDGKK